MIAFDRSRLHHTPTPFHSFFFHSMAAPPCCPPGSEPKLAATYKFRGTNQILDDLPYYHVGTGDKAIIVVYEVYGSDGGRMRLICDQLADVGFNVVMPDFYRGDNWPEGADFAKFGEWVIKFPWSKLEKDIFEKIVPFLEKQGVKKFGSIGFCWGAWVVFHASASEKFYAGVSAHPSVRVAGMLGENELELTKAIKCPQLLMPAGNDPENVKKGGDHIVELKKKSFGDKCEVVEFSDQNHGWLPRGDINKPEVAKGVKEGMEQAILFFQKHLN